MSRIVTFLIGSVLLIAAVGCGDDDASNETPSSNAIAAFRPNLNAADPRLKGIYEEASQLLGGGRAAYDRRIATLHGLPIVVNKWGSWCGPCRNEFPLFQQAARDRGGHVAFLGVNVSDGRSDALGFLRERPLPYPSFVDPRLFISQLLPPAAAAPSTGFYDRSGTLTHVKAGEYRNATELSADIRRYALGE